MYKIYRVLYDTKPRSHGRRSVNRTYSAVGGSLTLDRARKTLQQHSDAGDAGVFVQYPPPPPRVVS